MSAGAIIGLATVSAMLWAFTGLAVAVVRTKGAGERASAYGLAITLTVILGAGSCAAAVSGAVTAGQDGVVCGR